jgi:precorrin-4 methylase
MAVAAMKRGLQRAQVLVFFALVLPMVLLPLAAYAIDAAASASAFAKLEEVTVRCAEEAAQQVDVTRLRSGGGFYVNVAGAVAAAQQVLTDSLPDATIASVSVSGTRVTVQTRMVVTLPLQLVGPATVTIHVTASARLAVGYGSPSSLLPLPTSTF